MAYIKTDGIECCIWDSINNCFIYDGLSENNLREEKNWSKDEATLFMRILGRIKAGRGIINFDNTDVKAVYLPIAGGHMTVYFEPLSKMQFFLNNVRLEYPKKK